MYIPAQIRLGEAAETISQISGSSSLPDNAETTQIRDAIARGKSDPVKLTNLVFFLRHKERHGRKLTRGEPQFAQLATEWLQIRNALVSQLSASVIPGSTIPAAPISSPAIPSRPAGSAPRLVDRETSPPANTLYVEIPLVIGWAENRDGKSFKVPALTGIFIPKDYRPQLELDLILYLHGHKTDYPGDSASIQRYWESKKFPFFGLREKLNDSGKNVILVAPTLGPRSQAGTLNKPGWFNKYLDQVLTALSVYGPYQQAAQPPRIGNIILACHSGGGSPMLRIVENRDAYTTKIRECWGFDCLYSGFDKKTKGKLYTQPQRWKKWAAADHSKKLFIYFQHTTGKESLYLAGKARESQSNNIEVTKSNAVDHFWVPLAHWEERIKRASFLSDK